MNKFPRVVCWMACVSLWAGAWTKTQAQSGEVPTPERAKFFLDPAEMLVRSVPAETLQRLRNSATAQEAAGEINRYLSQYAIDKSLVLHTKVEAAQARPDVRNAFRIRAESKPIVWRGGTMQRLSWLYFQEPEAAAANSIKVGADITVTGWVRRCEVVITEEGPQLNFDVLYARIIDASNPLPPRKETRETTARAFSPAGIAGTWVWDSVEKIYPGTIDFEANGTGSHGARNNLTWQVTGERQITITHATRGTAVIRFDATGETFAGTDYYGKAVSGRRFGR